MYSLRHKPQSHLYTTGHRQSQIEKRSQVMNAFKGNCNDAFPKYAIILEWLALKPVPGCPNKFGATTCPQKGN